MPALKVICIGGGLGVLRHDPVRVADGLMALLADRRPRLRALS